MSRPHVEAVNHFLYGNSISFDVLVACKRCFTDFFFESGFQGGRFNKRLEKFGVWATKTPQRQN